MQRLYILASVAFCVASATAFAAEWKPPTTEIPKDDAAYIAKAKTAAPPAVANNTTRDRHLRDHDHERSREKMRSGTEVNLTTSDALARSWSDSSGS